MQIQKPKPVNEQIYEYLFSQIIDGTLPAGTRLTTEKIAEQLGVSRTPVRESILRLEHDGLLRDKCVIKPMPKEIHECYEVRILLESYAAKRAALTMSDAEKQHLKDLVASADNGDFEAKMKAHTEFHHAIVQACENDQISQFIERMQAIILLCRRDIVRNRAELLHEHGDIYQAILDGDGDAAERLMKEHLTENYQNMLRRLENF